MTNIRQTQRTISIIALVALLALAAACGSSATPPGAANTNASSAAQPAPASTTEKVSAPNANTAAHQDAAEGGMREAGDTSLEVFEGTTGSTEKNRLTMPPVVMLSMRTAHHPNFDRVVFEFQGESVPGYRIEYVKKPITNCAGEDGPVSVAGNAWLSISLLPAQAHTEEGAATIKEREMSPNLDLLKQLKSTCDFEADVTWVLGLAARKPYRVLELNNPARIVVDIKH